jgi:hypothetical protein
MRSGASACGDDPVDPGTQSFDPAFAVETIDAVLDALAASEVPVMLSQVHYSIVRECGRDRGLWRVGPGGDLSKGPGGTSPPDAAPPLNRRGPRESIAPSARV